MSHPMQASQIPLPWGSGQLGREPSAFLALFSRPRRSRLDEYTDDGVENGVAYCQTIASRKHLPVRTALSLSVPIALWSLD